MSSNRALLWISSSLALALGLYLGACWLVLTTLIVPKQKPHAASPAELGFADARELAFGSRAGDVRLRGWLVPAPGEPAVILIHGLHSHAWHCGTPDLVRAYGEAGFDVLLFDLRAHGASGGEHAGLGLLERGDVRAAVDVLLQEGSAPGRIGVHGRSYGAAVALLAAAQIDAVAAVVADSAFASARDAIGAEFNRRTGLPSAAVTILLPGMRLLGLAIYDVDLDDAAPERAIAQIAPRPVLLIHGTDDAVIPYAHAERLAAAGPSARLWSLPGAGHTQGVRMVPDCAEFAPTRNAYLRRVTGFFERHLAPGNGAVAGPAMTATSGR